MGYLGSIPGLGRAPGEGKGDSLQYFGLENSMGSQRVGNDLTTFTFTLDIYPGVRIPRSYVVLFLIF